MKAYFLVLLMCLMGHSGYSQLSYGGKAGINVSNLKFTEINPVDYRNRVGINLGIFAEQSIKEKLLLRSEIVYSIKGCVFTPYTSASNGILSLHYINVPVILGYKASQDITVYAGPEFGYLALASSGKAGYEDFDIGVSGGIFYNYNSVLQLDARYTYGFPMLVKHGSSGNNGTDSGTKRDGSNRTLQFGVSYFLLRSE